MSQAGTGLHVLYGHLRAGLQRFYHALDIIGRVLHSLCQGAHFISYHSKTSPRLARTSGLNSGVQCQQIGLLGNAADDLDNTADIFAVFRQCLHMLCATLNAGGQSGDSSAYLLDLITTAAG